METTGIRQGMGIMHSDVMNTFFQSGDAWDSMPKIECANIGSSLFRMNLVLSYVKCTGLTGNFSLALSI